MVHNFPCENHKIRSNLCKKSTVLYSRLEDIRSCPLFVMFKYYSPLKRRIPGQQWLHNSFVDTCFYSFGWLLMLAPLLMFRNDIYYALYYSGSLSEISSHPEIMFPAIIVLVVFMVNYVHRHLTFVLVYGDSEEFDNRKITYLVLPLFISMITAGFLYFNVFAVLLTLSVMWTMYHSVAQKYGLTRIYSRKAGYGASWLDRAVIFSWFAYLVFALADKEKETLQNYSAGRTILEYIGDYVGLMGIISYVVFAVALLFTARYIASEYDNRHRISIPKNLYVFSILFLYSLFLYDMVIGYIVFAFSHGIEYIAFVNMYVKKKYRQYPTSRSLLAKASRKLWLYSSLFSLLIVLLCLIGMNYDNSAFATYIVGSSFLHFLYDGWIWKLRKPDVGKPLDIKYAST
jgi:hypothetical protein